MPKNNLPEFMRMQFEFTKWLRNPKKGEEPLNLEARRMQVYRELFLNNIEGFCASAYPVTKSILDHKWVGFVADFFEKHRCKTPYFREISEEFLEFMQQEDIPAYLLELMHYEWVELALTTDEAIAPEISGIKLSDSLKLNLSPLAWVLAYNYPVYEIDQDYLPGDVSPTLLLVYRNVENEVKFILLNSTTYLALKALEGESLTVNEIIEILQAEHNIQLDKEIFEVQVQRFLDIGVFYV